MPLQVCWPLLAYPSAHKNKSSEENSPKRVPQRVGHGHNCSTQKIANMHPFARIFEFLGNGVCGNSDRIHSNLTIRIRSRLETGYGNDRVDFAGSSWRQLSVSYFATSLRLATRRSRRNAGSGRRTGFSSCCCAGSREPGRSGLPGETAFRSKERCTLDALPGRGKCRYEFLV